MMKIATLSIALALAASSAFADNRSKEDKIRRLATLGGITTRLDEEVAQVLSNGRRTEEQMMAQVNANLDVPGSFRPKFDQANKKFMDALQPQWTTFEVIDVFVRAYSPMVSEEDADAALAYLTSAAGKRNAAAQTEAANQIAAMVAAKSGNRGPEAAQAYVAELRSLVQECNCQKKAAAPKK
jgi:hypothetical protein